MKLAETLLHGLKLYGAKEIFALPGDFILPFFKVMEESNILPFYTFSHEPAIGFAADASARYNSGLGVAVVTYGAGALNMVNAVACAYSEKSPVVVISGAPGTEENKSGYLLHHQTKTLDSQLEIYKEVTVAQLILNDPRTAHEEIAKILRICLEESRPVYIEFPRNMVSEESQPVPMLPIKTAMPDSLKESAEEIIRTLKQAKNPIMMVGVETRRYGLEDKIAELAKKLGVPVVTSFMGSGLLAELDCQFLGTYLGLAGQDEVTNLVENSDGLLLLGVILSDTNFGISSKRIDMRKAIHATDGQVKFGSHLYPEIPITELVDKLLSIAEPIHTTDIERRFLQQEPLIIDEEKVSPDDIACAINDLFVKHGTMPITSDVGDCLFTAMNIKDAELIASAYYVTMGFAVPAGMGIELSSGTRPLILVGDGAFQMTGWELGHCRRHNLKPIILLFNNDGWEMLRTFQPDEHYCEIGKWSFAKLANDLGGKGHLVKTRAELQAAMDEAIADDSQFHLLDIIIEKGCISSTLDNYASGIMQLSAKK